MRTVAAVLALVTCVHVGLWASLRTKEMAPDFTGQLASISYAPFVASQHPDYGDRPTVEQIRTDLRAIAPYTRAIRTYSATGGAGDAAACPAGGESAAERLAPRRRRQRICRTPEAQGTKNAAVSSLS